MKYRDVEYTVALGIGGHVSVTFDAEVSATGQAMTKVAAVSEAERSIDRALAPKKLRVPPKSGRRWADCLYSPPLHQKELPKQIGVSGPKQTLGLKAMDRKPEEASEVQRKSIVILSDRSREIIRLFEERERKRHAAEQNNKAASLSQDECENSPS